MKKLYTFALFLSATVLPSLAAWDGSETSWTEGDGTEAAPYIISNEQHLAYLRSSVSNGESMKDKFFRLTADLDMSGLRMNPIGIFDDYTLEGSDLIKESKAFLGSFDGNNHTIDNLTIVYADPENLGGVGLFAVGRESTVIRNLKLGKGVTVDAPDSYSVGGIMGFCDGAKIYNCLSDGKVNGGGGDVGGIAGTVHPGSVIDGCIANGEVNAHTTAGGIAGFTNNSTVSNCFSSASITCPDAYMVGGIVGWSLKSTVSSCVAVGKVEAAAGSTFLPGKSPVVSELEESTASNCFYVESLTGCAPLVAQTGVTALSEDGLKDDEVLAALNGEGSAWKHNGEGIPMLAWTLGGTSSIKAPAAVAATVKAAAGAIVVEATAATAAIYDITGSCICSAAVNGSATFTPGRRGIYVVVVSTEGASASYKVIL